MTKNDLFILIASHVIVADNEIEMNETNYIKNYPNIPNEIIEEQVKIFSDSENKTSLDDLLEKAKILSIEEKEELFIFLFKVGYADNFFHSKENNIVNLIANKLDFPSEKLVQLQENEEQNADKLYVEKNKTILDSIYSFAYKFTKSDFFEKRLLDGQDFVEKIKSISASAKSDLDYANKYMDEVNSNLKNQYNTLLQYSDEITKHKRNDETSDELINFSTTLNKELKEIIDNNLKNNSEILDKKKRTIDYFTIAFMGRTKAGKSTFHKVVTGENLDDIGVGKLRTTRYNRAFNWENLRIVDTPGIGAPGGKSDTETAKTIIDEADLVCYVVTNDSIQETEFDFLKQLKEKNKPLFIILNVKENIENKIRLKRFLENPLKWKDNDGDKSIQGHFDRIKELIQKDYDINSIEIIPVQLLAAILSENKEAQFSEKERKLLKEGSNIDEYNSEVKKTIFRTGHLKKTQNIIDGCNYQVQTILKEVNSSLLEINKIKDSLTNNRDILNDFIKKEKEKTKQQLIGTITNEHRSLKNQIDVFATNNYDKSESELKRLWKLESDKYYQILQDEIKIIFSDFEKNLKNKIEEVQEDFEMEMNQNFGQVNIESHDTTNYKRYMGIGGSVIGAVGGMLIYFGLASNPVGWAITIGSIIVGGLSYFFESKAKKIEKAKTKIRESVIASIDKSEIEYKKNIVENFEKAIVDISKKLNDNFNALVEITGKIISILENIRNENSRVENIFNNIVFYRILQHLNIEKQQLSNDVLNQFMLKNKIIRDFQKASMEINSPFQINGTESNEISQLLQSKIQFNKI